MAIHGLQRLNSNKFGDDIDVEVVGEKSQQ